MTPVTSVKRQNVGSLVVESRTVCAGNEL